MDNKEKKKINKSHIFIFIMQYVIVEWAYKFFCCACGYSVINMGPINIFWIIQLIIYVVLVKKEYKHKGMYIFVSLVLLILLMIFTRNDLEEMHNPVIIDYR